MADGRYFFKFKNRYYFRNGSCYENQIWHDEALSYFEPYYRMQICKFKNPSWWTIVIKKQITIISSCHSEIWHEKAQTHS